MTDAYAAALGVLVESASDGAARLRVPFADANANPGGALHGGVAASLIAIGAAAATGPGGVVVDATVHYLAAAIAEDVVADARVLRRGKELAYVAVDVATAAGKAIATGLVVWRGGAEGPADRRRLATATARAAGDARLPSFVRVFTAAPFMGRLGIAARDVADGGAHAVLPWQAANADATGALHPGAVAALVDTTGALASWTLVPLEPRNKASTPALHVAWHAAARDEDVAAVATVVRRTDELFQSTVAVHGERSGRLVATGTVTYRIVVP
ncbi:MAG: hotdog fold thioesterase [bacterium]|nr:hotdog fold thioesterase [bacterium]